MDYGRTHWYTPDELNEDQREFYDLLMAGPRDPRNISDSEGRLIGMFNARLLHPKVGAAIQEVSAQLRFGNAFTPRETELIILSVAEDEKCNFEFVAHARYARKAGMGDAELEALRTRTPIPGLCETEALVIRVVHSLLDTGDLDDQLFSEAADVLGKPKIFDIVTLVNHYRHTAMALRVWRVPLASGDEPVFD